MMTFGCLECGRKFRTAAAAERAANHGCPGCGGVDIDLDVVTVREASPAAPGFRIPPPPMGLA